MKIQLLYLLAAVIFEKSWAAPQEDLIKDLPGLTWKLNFTQYSGYLKASGTKKLHYWLTESENDPKSDPVVLWLNGGPGCSSLIGIMMENGPFRVEKDGKTLTKNPYAWNKVANVVYLEAPAGVGFSYSDDPIYVSDDKTTAHNNHLALRDFFKKFPEYQKNDFYITGESYAGIYVPTLASLVLNDSSINFKGFAVGNGVSDNDKGANSLAYFLRYHGVFGEAEWNALWTNCCKHTSGEKFCDFEKGAKHSAMCLLEINKLMDLVWHSGLNPYNMFAECPGGVKDLTLRYDPLRKKFVSSNFGYPIMSTDSEVSRRYRIVKEIAASDIEMDPPCTNGTAQRNYLNMPETRRALHIPSQVQPYTTCASNLSYTQLYKTMAPQYQKAINSKRLRILVYNGDTDMVCNFIGDEWFVDDLNLNDGQERISWHYRAEDGTKQVAGYVKAFPKSNVTFLTIKGSGHYVPTDKPIPALTMLEHFLSGKPFN